MAEYSFTCDPAYLILAALSGEDLHGYGIMKEVELMSRGQARLALGTLYGALDRLVQRGLVQMAREEHQGRRVRRYYHLTQLGVDELQREAELHSRLIEATRERIQMRRPVTPALEGVD